MKKLLAILLAAAMLFALAACGDKTTGDTTTTTAAEEEITDAPVEESTDAPVEESSAADTSDASEAPSEEETSAEESSAPAAAEMTKAEFVAFLNAETAKAAKGSYNYNRNCSYTNPIDVGGATDILNGIIKAIDENSSLDTVVGDFLGIGVKKGTMPKDGLKDDYQIKATKLTEADLQNFSYADGVYSFTLANATNPKKTNATPLSRFTNDFITHEEVVDGIAGFTSAIKVNSTTVNYDKIQVQVTVADGKITSIKYAYAFDAQLSLKAVVTINGTGSAMTQAAYTAIKY